MRFVMTMSSIMLSFVCGSYYDGFECNECDRLCVHISRELISTPSVRVTHSSRAQCAIRQMLLSIDAPHVGVECFRNNHWRIVSIAKPEPAHNESNDTSIQCGLMLVLCLQLNSAEQTRSGGRKNHNRIIDNIDGLHKRMR